MWESFSSAKIKILCPPHCQRGRLERVFVFDGRASLFHKEVLSRLTDLLTDELIE